MQEIRERTFCFDAIGAFRPFAANAVDQAGGGSSALPWFHIHTNSPRLI